MKSTLSSKKSMKLNDAASQYHFAQKCLRENQWGLYHTWLEQAASNNHLESLIEMGENLLYKRHHSNLNISKAYDYLLTAKQQLDCYVIQMDTIPNLQTLSKLVNTAFIRIKSNNINKLYYFDKSRMLMKELHLSKNELEKFDKLDKLIFPHPLTIKNIESITEKLGITFPSLNLSLKIRIEKIFTDKVMKDLLKQYISNAQGIKYYRNLTFQVGIKVDEQMISNIKHKIEQFINSPAFLTKIEAMTMDQKILLICYIIDFDPTGLKDTLKFITNNAYLAFRHDEIKEPFRENNYLTFLASGFIRKLLKHLNEYEKKEILQTALGMINDHRVPVIDKKFIMDEIAPELSFLIQYRNTDILPTLLESKTTEFISKELVKSILETSKNLKVNLSLGEALLLMYGYLRNDPHVDKQKIKSIYDDYVNIKYEEALKTIYEIFENANFKFSNKILEILKSINFKEDKITKNFSRRFFENKISQLFLTNEMDLNVMQKFCQPYGFNPVTRVEAYRAILHIEERLSIEEFGEKGPKIQRELTYKKGSIIREGIEMEQSFRRSGVSVSLLTQVLLNSLFQLMKDSSTTYNATEFLESIRDIFIIRCEYKTSLFQSMHIIGNEESDTTKFLKLLKQNETIGAANIQAIINSINEAITSLKSINDTHITSLNLGTLTANSPNYIDERSSESHALRNPDVVLAEKGSYAEIRQRSSLVRSLSGHAAFFIMHLEKYMKAHKGEATLNEEINQIVKTFAMIYISMGYHSYLEVMDVFNDKNLKDFFKIYNVEIDPTLSIKVMDEAFKDTEIYNKTLIQKRLAHFELENNTHHKLSEEKAL